MGSRPLCVLPLYFVRSALMKPTRGTLRFMKVDHS
jgi:hypothetical protein